MAEAGLPFHNSPQYPWIESLQARSLSRCEQKQKLGTSGAIATQDYILSSDQNRKRLWRKSSICARSKPQSQGEAQDYIYFRVDINGQNLFNCL